METSTSAILVVFQNISKTALQKPNERGSPAIPNSPNQIRYNPPPGLGAANPFQSCHAFFVTAAQSQHNLQFNKLTVWEFPLSFFKHDNKCLSGNRNIFSWIYVASNTREVHAELIGGCYLESIWLVILAMDTHILSIASKSLSKTHSLRSTYFWEDHNNF